MLRVLLAALVISMVLTGCGKKEDPNATEINPWGLSDDGAILGSGSGSDYMPGDMPLGGLSGVNFTDPSQYHDPAIAAEAAATLRTLYFKYNSYDIQSAEAFFIVASDESNGIVSGYVAATLGCIPFKCGVNINHRVEGVGVVFVVLDFPEVLDSAVVGSGVVFKRNGGMLNGGEYRLPGE